MFGMSAMVKALCDCVAKIMDYKSTKVENQETTNILGDKKDLEKAGNIAEHIIEIARKYESSMSGRDQRKLKSLIKKFNKVD